MLRAKHAPILFPSTYFQYLLSPYVMPNIQKHVAEIPPERPDISQSPSDAGDYCSGQKTWLIQNRLGREKTMAGPVERPPVPLPRKMGGAPTRSPEPEPGAVRRGCRLVLHSYWNNTGHCWGSPGTRLSTPGFPDDLTWSHSS